MSESTEYMQEVLIAEDDQDDFDIFAEAIKDLSLKVILSRAENGDILLKILHEKKPDLLFLDVLMPCKDGRACLHEIRAKKEFDELPIIVYSSLADLNTVEFFYRRGTNLYIVKPYTYRELVDTLRKIFAIDWRTLRYYPKFSEYVVNPQNLQ